MGSRGRNSVGCSLSAGGRSGPCTEMAMRLYFFTFEPSGPLGALLGRFFFSRFTACPHTGREGLPALRLQLLALGCAAVVQLCGDTASGRGSGLVGCSRGGMGWVGASPAPNGVSGDGRGLCADKGEDSSWQDSHAVPTAPGPLNTCARGCLVHSGREGSGFHPHSPCREAECDSSEALQVSP